MACPLGIVRGDGVDTGDIPQLNVLLPAITSGGLVVWSKTHCLQPEIGMALHRLCWISRPEIPPKRDGPQPDSSTLTEPRWLGLSPEGSAK